MTLTQALTGFILLTGSSCLPLPARATTLLQAVAAASEYDSAIAAALNAKKAGNEAFDQGIAGLLPSIGLDSSYSIQDQPHAPYARAVTRHNYSVNLTQPLFDVAKVAAFQRGSAISDLADVEFVSAQQKLIGEVSDAFFAVLYQREVLQASRAASQAFRQQLAMASASLRIGEGTKTDLDEAQANYDRALANEVTARNDLDVANGTYQRITGLNADSVDPIRAECVRPPAVGDIKNVMAMAAKYNLEVIKAEFQLAQSKSDVVATSSGHLPVVSLQASYGGNWSRAEGNDPMDAFFGTTQKTRNSSIGINVSVPIFNGGGALSQSREALRRRDQARDMLEDSRRKAAQEARSAWLGVTNGMALLEAQKKASRSAASKVKSSEYGRDLGLRTIVDVLNSQQDFYQSQQNISEAKYKYLTSKLNLALILGQLTVRTLAEFECADNGLLTSGKPAFSHQIKG